MNRIYQHLSLLIFLMTFAACSEEVNHEDLLLKAVNNPNRNVEYVARDKFRHPYETLSFFNIAPSMHVLELSAGGGW